jgi:ketosteroid isomerase-like protein
MDTSGEARNLATAREFLEAIERGVDTGTLARYFHPDVVQEEFPNRIVPQGARRDLAALCQSYERGKQVVSAQRYEVRNALASGNQVAMELVWTGTLAIDLGTLSAGSELRAYIGVVMEFRDGKIVGQRNYDCYEPW